MKPLRRVVGASSRGRVAGDQASEGAQAAVGEAIERLLPVIREIHEANYEA